MNYSSSLSFFTDCLLGPKPLDDEDVEAEGMEVEEEHRISIHRLVEMVVEEEEEENRVKVGQEEREGLLPGSGLREEAGAHPEPQSAVACSSGETGTSARDVVFFCPVLPYGTSL